MIIVGRTKKEESEAVYPLKELASIPNLLGAASSDIIMAAFHVKGINEATMEEAKTIVKEFSERKVQ